jgi:CheY-like chemotaxis protein
MKTITPGEPKEFVLAGAESETPNFRVLVADNVERDRQVTLWLLGRAWSDEREVLVECATDGAEAMEKIRRNEYALVVLDWNIPQKNGATVLRAIRANGRRIPVVVLSGQSRETIARDLEVWAAAFVSKDELDPDSFSHAVATASELLEKQPPEGSGPESA